MGNAADDVLGRYLEAIRRSPHNLVSRRALGELESRHLAESRALAEALPPGPAELVDVGTGGGFPGFVIAATRQDLDVTLLDATAKKLRFLEQTAAELDVRIRAVHGRAEDVAAQGLGSRFDLATARAVAPLIRLVPWALPLLRPGGSLWAVKGETWEEELEDARATIAAEGGEVTVTPDDPEGEITADPQGGARGPSGTPVRVVIIRRRRGRE